MKRFLTNTKMVIMATTIFSVLSLVLSIIARDVEWFQASGAVVTIGGVVLAARKILRLGIEKFICDEQTVDGGHFQPTTEEIERQNQFENDIDSYRWSVALLILGTLIWAYGGIILKMFCFRA
jgi:lysylphosphatidylglycerol synthetase-like protein (DUF2156 family)